MTFQIHLKAYGMDRIDVDREERLRRKFEVTLPLLDERQRRVFLAAEAEYWGPGGVSAVARASGATRVTVREGLKDLGVSLPGRVRAPGAGRPRLVDAQPGLLEALNALVEPWSRGDPMSPLRWTVKSTRQLAGELLRQGFSIGYKAVGDLLKKSGYSLQANVKTREGSNHPDRNEQFEHLAKEVAKHHAAGQPVISVDTKKKELVGDFKNGGREWKPKGEPEKVRVHDFKDPELGRAIPYGVYDVFRNEGWVNVGVDHDTAAFAVESIRRWWLEIGRAAYPDATEILISADGGGSNGSRVRLWKLELAKLAQETGLKITVCHLPPGTSKWNKIEHRLFSHITINWRGRPLVSHEVIVESIAATTTRTGLKVRAALDKSTYPTKLKVDDEALAKIALTRHDFHGEWNYVIEGFHTRKSDT